MGGGEGDGMFVYEAGKGEPILGYTKGRCGIVAGLPTLEYLHTRKEGSLVRDFDLLFESEVFRD